MKILHIINSLSFGGIESGVIRLSNEQSKNKDFSVHLLCVGRAKNIRINEVLPEVIVKRMPIKSNLIIEFINLIGFLRFLINFRKYIKNEKFDVVHSHINLMNFILNLLTKIFHKNTLFISNTYTTHNFFNNKYLGNVLRKFNRYICIKYSDICASDSESSWNFCFGDSTAKDKVIIPMPIDLINNLNKSRLRDNEKNSKSLVIGNIGRFVSQKNQIFLINLLHESKKFGLNWKLIMIGSGILKNNLIKKSQELKVDNQIEFLEPLSNLDDFYNSIDVFILPSHSESMPVTLLEAQSFGIGCIASTSISTEAAIIPSIVDFIDLECDLHFWVRSIIDMANKNKDKNIIRELLSKSELDTTDITARWLRLYNG